MSLLRRSAVALVSLALVAGPGLAAGGPPAAAAPAASVASVASAATAAAPSFYDPPPTLPAGNGRLVRSEPMRLGVSLDLPGLSGPLPARATRILYTSTDSSGSGVAVSGAYLEPTAPWIGVGPRPLVTFAEGTQGQGDQCAPSRTLESPLMVSGTSVALGYEVPSIYGLLTRGIAVVVTDYVGLGTTDRLHTYVNRLDQGRAVLDAARVARQVPGASVTASSRVAAYGYSQGGGATASAAELQPTYAPDVPLVAAYAGAPPANLVTVLEGIDGTALTGAAGWAVNGFAQSYPVIRDLVAREANAEGKRVLAQLATQCTGDAIVTTGFRRSNEWITSGKSLSQVLAENPQAQAVVDDQRIGRAKPGVPVRIVTGTQDDIVDHGQVRQLAVDWCRQGARVSYVPVVQPLPSGGTALNHVGPYVADALAAQQWTVDRLNGIPEIGNCLALPALP